MAEARAKSEGERWVGWDGEDVGGDDLAGVYESLGRCRLGHRSFTMGASGLKYLKKSMVLYKCRDWSRSKVAIRATRSELP